MRSDRHRLLDIHEAIENISRKIPPSKEEFSASEMHQIWVLYHLQIVGEAANAVSVEFRQEHKEIPWKKIVAMRNLLVHQYFGIDLQEVWDTVQNDLPPLKKEIGYLLQDP